MASKYPWVAGLATALSLVACYGTLITIAILGALGVAVSVDGTIWSGAIIGLALAAVGGLALGVSRHQKIRPVVTGGFGVVILSYAFYVRYSHWTELVGFTLLAAAVFRD
ncbi:MerC family mercury resistance protein [Salinisphaera orenii]|uniref:MerC family mercury resistance protein n=1 Tax=Salinisphaera orenii TaxID=856731 RepID=UPI000DBE279E